MGEIVMLDDLPLVVRELVKFDLTWSDGSLKSSLSIKNGLNILGVSYIFVVLIGMHCTLNCFGRTKLSFWIWLQYSYFC
jgi:hypothetical protein